jgi:hypothetical protein
MTALDFGWWALPSGQRGLLSWYAHSGELCLDAPLEAMRLAVVRDEDDVRKRLAGWEHHADTRDGLGWLAAQLEGCR